MPWLARLRSFKRNTLQRAIVERELADEASSVCELLAEEKMRQGMAPAAARRSARLKLGGVESWKEQAPTPAMERCWCRSASRSWARRRDDPPRCDRHAGRGGPWASPAASGSAAGAEGCSRSRWRSM
jgi:hypothetical protein